MMVDTLGITLVLTRRCNASCAHCGFSSSPINQETIDTKRACLYLEKARTVPTVQTVSITGGEPLLYPVEVREIFAYASSLGYEGELVTNAFWADDHETTMERLRDLRDNGALRTFVTSCDSYHAAFVPPERVRTAVRAALRLGLRVTVKSIGSGADTGARRRRVLDVLGLPGGHPRLRIDAGTPVRAGRGAALAHLGSIDAEGGCDRVMRFPAITPEDELYPCCAFGEPARRVGRAEPASLARLLGEMGNNLLFNLLAKVGPLGVWAMAFPGRAAPPFTNACDLCNVLYLDVEAEGAVERLLADLTTRRDRSPGNGISGAASQRVSRRTGSGRRR